MAEVFNVKKDCFAFNKNTNSCMALKTTYCKIEECKFYKKRGTLCKGCHARPVPECVKCKDARQGM